MIGDVSERESTDAGWNAVFCDGSVRTLSDSIDPELHGRLGNRQDCPCGRHEPFVVARFIGPRYRQRGSIRIGWCCPIVSYPTSVEKGLPWPSTSLVLFLSLFFLLLAW